MFKLDQALFSNYKVTFLTYCIFFIVISANFLVGDVIAPTRQEIEMGKPVSSSQNLPVQNSKFNDFPHSYIPAITEHLNGASSGWLVTWTNNNEAGRPTFHLGGFSPAYPITWLITQFTHNPWYLITIFSLFTCFLTGIFIILLCKELELVAFAALITSISFATTPFFMYWLTFPMFISPFCWGAGVLWSIASLAKKSNFWVWSVLTFCIYSLLLTASPQAIVYLAYLVCTYGCYLVYKIASTNQQKLLVFLGVVFLAVVISIGLALPIYLDLNFITSESARAATDASFFTSVLPQFHNFKDVVHYFVISTVPEFFGNPISPLYPFSYSGIGVSLIIIYFCMISLCTNLRVAWGLWLAIVVFCLMAFVQPIFLFFVQFLGFNLSRSIPTVYIILPITIIVAYGVDTLIKLEINKLRVRIIIFASATVFSIITIGFIYANYMGIPISNSSLLTMLCVNALLALQYNKTKPILLVLALFAVLLNTAYPLVLHQDPNHIANNSLLVDKVRNNLPLGSRFAIASPGLSVLPPNINATIGLSSIHSYNSLSSSRYHHLIKELGGEMRTFGRWNSHIAPDYSSTAFWMSNISLILSAQPLMHPNLKSIGQESGLYFYRVISTMGESLQMEVSIVDQKRDKILVSDPRLISSYMAKKMIDKGDWLEYQVASIQSSVLVLSQKFHRNWSAEVLTPKGWTSAQMTEVNGVFQGVLLPAETKQVRLKFKPFARYAWIAHFFWLFLILLLVAQYFKNALKK